MAFDQPLESDQIGDNALISFVTKPILGTLMWIIGDADDESNVNRPTQDKLLEQGLQDMMLEDDDNNNNNDDDDGHGGLPRLARSDVSVGAASMDPPSLLPRRSSFTHLLEDDSSNHNNNNNNNHSYPQDKKKMSWSEHLVEYMDDEVRRHYCYGSSSDKLALYETARVLTALYGIFVLALFVLVVAQRRGT